MDGFWTYHTRAYPWYFTSFQQILHHISWPKWEYSTHRQIDRHASLLCCIDIKEVFCNQVVSGFVQIDGIHYRALQISEALLYDTDYLNAEKNSRFGPCNTEYFQETASMSHAICWSYNSSSTDVWYTLPRTVGACWNSGVLPPVSRSWVNCLRSCNVNSVTLDTWETSLDFDSYQLVS